MSGIPNVTWKQGTYYRRLIRLGVQKPYRRDLCCDRAGRSTVFRDSRRSPCRSLLVLAASGSARVAAWWQRLFATAVAPETELFDPTREL